MSEWVWIWREGLQAAARGSGEEGGAPWAAPGTRSWRGTRALTASRAPWLSLRVPLALSLTGSGLKRNLWAPLLTYKWQKSYLPCSTVLGFTKGGCKVLGASSRSWDGGAIADFIFLTLSAVGSIVSPWKSRAPRTWEGDVNLEIGSWQLSWVKKGH